MRIQFSLTCQKGAIIPINYQSELSYWVFTVLSKASPELQAWIQKKGYDLYARTFKLFTFSPLAIYPYEMDQQRQEFKLMGNQVKITISIYLDQAFEQQIIHLFRQTPLELGMVDGHPARFEIKHWVIQPRPSFRDIMQFKAVSPISVTNVEEEKNNNPFLQPENEMYDISFFTHAVRRFKAAKQYKSLNNLKLLDPAYPMCFELFGQSRSRLIHLKSNPDGFTQLRGFTCEFEISMPIPLMEFCYYAGYGEYPHLGFGFVDFLEEGGNKKQDRPQQQQQPHHHQQQQHGNRNYNR